MDDLPYFSPDGLCEGWGHGIADLAIFFNDVARKLVAVTKALAPGAFADTYHPILIRVQDPSLLPLGIRFCDRGAEVSRPVQPPIQARPIIMPVRRMHKGEGDGSCPLPPVR